MPSHLTVELWRPAPGQTIKTDSPTQGDTQEKVPLLGSPTNDLLYCPNLTTAFYEWKTNTLSTGHGAVAVGKIPFNSTTSLTAHNTSRENRHDARLFFYLFPPFQHGIVTPRLARRLCH